jgi:alpha-aminoadipate carrier protein LysW
MQNVVNSPECPECTTPVTLAPDAQASEIVECLDCRSELEITSAIPPGLVLAPEVEEDWGE